MLVSFPNTSVTTSCMEIPAVRLAASSGTQGNPKSAGEQRGKYPLGSEAQLTLHRRGLSTPGGIFFLSPPPFPFQTLAPVPVAVCC